MRLAERMGRKAPCFTPHLCPDLGQESCVPFPLPQPSQIHGPVAAQWRQRHLGRSRGPGLDHTGLVAVPGDQVIAAVDLGLALEGDAQGSDLPDQFRSRRSIGRVERNVDHSPDWRAALFHETAQEAEVVGLSGQDQKAEVNGWHSGHFIQSLNPPHLTELANLFFQTPIGNIRPS